jgi:hypothetical protein
MSKKQLSARALKAWATRRKMAREAARTKNARKAKRAATVAAKVSTAAAA